ncbi:hypothetical protein [Streptomyces sp. NPDC007905]|uniref:hypothetical protein n=1 Tax=Streptomyces sp. NPDC007905 TaxID=3364788 RepID=UPI0036ED2F66
MTLVRRVLRTPPDGQTVRDIARTSADAILGIPLPHRYTPDAPGLTDSTEASRLLAGLARAGWPATTRPRTVPSSPLLASQAPSGAITTDCPQSV